MTKKKAPGKHWRKGLTLVELIRKFPDDKTAEAWIASIRWPDGPRCPHCDHDNIQHPTAHKTMPCRCRRNGCRKFFSVKVGTVMQDSKLGYQEWAIAVYLFNTSLKGVSSMKLHRDLGISQKSAWHLAHRIRQCWDDLNSEPFDGPVEADETFIGGLAKNMHAKVRKHRIHGRGGVDKTAVAGIKDRATGKVSAQVVANTDRPTLQGFVKSHTTPSAMVYTDDHKAYSGLPRRSAPQRRRIRQRPSPRQRRRKLLGRAQARLPRHTPPHECQTPRPLRGRVRGPSQPPPARHRGHDGRERAGHDRTSQRWLTIAHGAVNRLFAF